MQVSVEKSDALKRRMTIEFPSTDVDSKVDSRIKEIGQTIRMKGFRPGRVPLKIVQQRYGAQVRSEVLGEVLNENLQKAFVQEELRPVGRPEVEPVEDPKDDVIAFTASFEVYPELEDVDVSKLAIEKPVCEIQDKDIDDMLDTLRQQQLQWKTVERAAKKDDLVLFTYSVTHADGRFPEEGDHRSACVVGKGALFEDFEKLFKGKKAEDALSEKLAFPDSFPEKDLRGVEGDTEITVLEVKESTLPEVDDEFAKAFGVEGGVEQLRKDVRDNLEREMKAAVSNKMRRQVADKLIEAHTDMEIPTVMIDQEVESLRQQAEQSNQDMDQDFEKQARERVLAGIVMSEIARLKEIEVDQGRVRDEVNALASTYEDQQAVVNAYYQNEQLIGSVQARVMEEQVVEWVSDHAKVTEKEISFPELMGRSAT